MPVPIVLAPGPPNVVSVRVADATELIVSAAPACALNALPAPLDCTASVAG